MNVGFLPDAERGGVDLARQRAVQHARARRVDAQRAGAARPRRRRWRSGTPGRGPRPAPRTTGPSSSNGRPSSARRADGVAGGDQLADRASTSRPTSPMATGGITATPIPRSAPSCVSRRGVAGPPAPEAEVVADDDVARAQVAAQHVAHEGVGAAMAANSRVNGSTIASSMPASATAPAAVRAT